MPKTCRYMRTKLQIEYLRLLDWCAVAGLIEYKEGQDLPDSLKAERLVLVAILTEIRSLMDDFANINGKYKKELRPDDTRAARKDAEDIDLVEEFSSITLSYEKTTGEKRRPIGTNHLLAHMKMAKEIASNPKRLVWVAFDEKVFLKLLGRLTELNDYLQELLQGHQARKLEQLTEKSYMEMVQVRSSIEELKHLVTAAMLLPDRGNPSASSASRRKNSEAILARLADFKALNAATEAPSNQKPPDYNSIIASTHLNYSQVPYTEPPSPNGTSSSDRTRAQGKFYPGDKTFRHVFIEWKPYKDIFSEELNRHVPLPENIKRVRELVALLQSPKPSEFRAPTCFGYFDDRDDDPQHSEHESRFGLVFEKPADAIPVSLHQLLNNPRVAKPSLTARVQLAHKISICILYLHAVNWLHKSLRSDSILFFLPPSLLSSTDTSTIRNLPLENPYLTGYDYARPDRPGETTTGGDVDEWTELYLHPSYQGSGTKGTYRKTFDLYSLGVVLLEIAFWSPIEKIMEIDMEAQDIFAIINGMRGVLLAEGGGAGVMERLRADLGGRYWEAVTSCLQGKEAFGITEGSEGDVAVGAKLQAGFMEKVTEGLEGICV
ncbi:MAG: hypothetical protein LQ351_003148 [Letrouitia transgressa]|nr:MAG: hypothetical protein LQ351_003148 [Letrouitia transgressa]